MDVYNYSPLIFFIMTYMPEKNNPIIKNNIIIIDTSFRTEDNIAKANNISGNKLKMPPIIHIRPKQP